LRDNFDDRGSLAAHVRDDPFGGDKSARRSDRVRRRTDRRRGRRSLSGASGSKIGRRRSIELRIVQASVISGWLRGFIVVCSAINIRSPSLLFAAEKEAGNRDAISNARTETIAPTQKTGRIELAIASCNFSSVAGARSPRASGSMRTFGFSANAVACSFVKTLFSPVERCPI